MYGLLHLVGQHGTFHFFPTHTFFPVSSRNAFLRRIVLFRRPAIIKSSIGSSSKPEYHANFMYVLPSLSPHSHSLTHTHNTHRGENTYVPVDELASKPVPFLPVSSTTITKSLSHSSLSKTYRKKLIVAIVKAIDQSGVTSFPPSLPKEIVSNLSLSRRKSSRSRTSRLIQVGKHSVLRENDYDMENGITTISGSVQSQQLRDVVRLSSSLLLPLSLSNITTSHSNTSRYDLVPHLIFFVWTRCLLSK